MAYWRKYIVLRNKRSASARGYVRLNLTGREMEVFASAPLEQGKYTLLLFGRGFTQRMYMHIDGKFAVAQGRMLLPCNERILAAILSEGRMLLLGESDGLLSDWKAIEQDALSRGRKPREHKPDGQPLQPLPKPANQIIARPTVESETAALMPAPAIKTDDRNANSMKNESQYDPLQHEQPQKKQQEPTSETSPPQAENAKTEADTESNSSPTLPRQWSNIDAETNVQQPTGSESGQKPVSQQTKPKQTARKSQIPDIPLRITASMDEASDFALPADTADDPQAKADNETTKSEVPITAPRHSNINSKAEAAEPQPDSDTQATAPQPAGNTWRAPQPMGNVQPDIKLYGDGWEWESVSIPGSGFTYLLGRAEQHGETVAVAVAVPGEYAPSPPANLTGFSGYSAGYWVLAQDANTGERIGIQAD